MCHFDVFIYICVFLLQKSTLYNVTLHQTVEMKPRWSTKCTSESGILHLMGKSCQRKSESQIQKLSHTLQFGLSLHISHASFRAGRDNTTDDFADFPTFKYRQGNESVKSPATVVSTIACPYSVVVYSLHVMSVAILCTKMPWVRLAVNIVLYLCKWL